MRQLDPKYVWKHFLKGSSGILVIMFIIALGFTAAKFGNPPIESYESKTIFSITTYLLIILLFLLSISWIWAKLTHQFYRYELREEGLRKESGVILKTYSSIPYSRIQNIDIYRDLLDRILGLSRLHIQTAGNNIPNSSEGKLPGLSVETAEQLREELIKRINNAKTSSGGV